MDFLRSFKWYRKLMGGVWYEIYWPANYGHCDYSEWTRDKNLTQFPWFAKLLRTEVYH